VQRVFVAASGYREVSHSDRNGSIRMLNVDRYFDAIDAARVRRVRELSDIKRQFGADRGGDSNSVNSKAAVVLTMRIGRVSTTIA
jgi:hypothetical protein